MNLGAWTGPKEEVSGEQLTGNETGDFGAELMARGNLVTHFMRRLAHLHERERWGFKILGDIVYADYYAKIWPNATFILVVRDPRDHALSLMKLNEQRASRGQPNFYDDYAAVACGWKKTVREGMTLLTSHGLKHVVLRYEDLVAAPEEQLRRLANTLDIDLTEGLKFNKQGFIEQHIKRFKHHENLTNPINTGSVGKWRKEMTDGEAKVFVDFAGELMAEYGYLE
jgi:hypothetical protein